MVGGTTDKERSRNWHFALLVVALGLFGEGSALAAATKRAPVTVFAAASLVDAMREIEAMTLEATSGYRLRVSLAASSVLARQIEHGVPADLFISADERWMDDLETRGLIDQASRHVLLGNRLVLVGPGSEQFDLIGPDFPLAALLGKRRLALADPDHVPAGRYAKEALESLGFWPGVRDRLAPAQDVRFALAFVMRGEVPLGIIYESDARALPANSGIAIRGLFPETSHTPIRYPMARIAGAEGAGVAAVYAFLRSSEAAAIFRRLGFQVSDHADAR